MTREELKARFLELTKNRGLESLGVSVEKCLESFIECLLIPFERIEKLYLYDFMESENNGFVSCYFDIETSVACYRMSYDIKQNNKRKLTKTFVDAIRSFNEWGGEIEYIETEALLIESEIFLQDLNGGRKNLWEALTEMRDYIMETMVGCACDWGDGNVNKWVDYSRYIMPILQAIDLWESSDGSIKDILVEE